MINIQQINAKTMTDTRDSILQSAISSDNSRLENLNTIADWMIDNVPWVGEATNEKLNFIFNSPLIFGGDEAFTTAQGLIGHEADCVGQTNSFAFLAEDFDVSIAGYKTTHDSSHRVAVINGNEPKVFDISLCQSYKQKYGNVPENVKFMAMDEYIQRAPIDIPETMSHYGMKDNILATSKLDVPMMLSAYQDLSTIADLSDALLDLSNMDSNMEL